MSGNHLSEPERGLLDALLRVLNEVPRAVEDDLRTAADLSTAEYQVLSNLADAHPGMLRLTELAEQTGVSKSRASRLANSLVGRGHATREPVSEDGRGLRLGISEQGLGKVKAAQASYTASVRRHVLEPLTRDGLDLDLAALTRLMRGLPS